MKHRSMFIAVILMTVMGLLFGACAPKLPQPPLLLLLLPSPRPQSLKRRQLRKHLLPRKHLQQLHAQEIIIWFRRTLVTRTSTPPTMAPRKLPRNWGSTVQYQGPATADATQQITLLNSLIAQKPYGLAISANDSDALVPTGKSAMAAGIPVVTWDSAIGTDGRNLHINQAVTAGYWRHPDQDGFRPGRSRWWQDRRS